MVAALAGVDLRRPAELAHGDDQRLVEQPAERQVVEQGRERGRARGCSSPARASRSRWRRLEAADPAVGVPDVEDLADGVEVHPVDGHEPDPGLDQAAGQQEALAVLVAAVAVAEAGVLAIEVEGPLRDRRTDHAECLLAETPEAARGAGALEPVGLGLDPPEEALREAIRARSTPSGRRAAPPDSQRARPATARPACRWTTAQLHRVVARAEESGVGAGVDDAVVGDRPRQR